MDRQLVMRRRAMERERARFDADGEALSAVDRRVRDSWLRCRPQVPAAQAAAPLDQFPAERWDASPVRRATPELLGELRTVAESGDLVASVADGEGRLLWVAGSSSMRSRAEAINAAVGARWDEASSGTNGVALALITGRPATVFSVEHWCAGVADWVCYSAPVHDAAGRPAAVITLSATWDRANPLGLTTVSTLARIVEHQLRPRERGAQPPPKAALAALRPVLELDLLGGGAARLDGVPVPLTPRQVEVLAVLACIGAATLDELHTLLFGERPVSLTTTKVEVSRLRRALGGVIASRPYRIDVPVDLDLERLLRRLAAGDVAGACAAYTGQVVPGSDAPLLVERRHHCDVALRTAVLHAGTAADLLAYARVHPFDVEVLETAVRRAAPDDPLLAHATARLHLALGGADPS